MKADHAAIDIIMTRVLIVEDQPAVSKALGVLFDLHGIDSHQTSSASEALEAITRGEVDLLLQDMNFSAGETSGEEGIALFREARRRDSELPILLITAWTSLETAVQLVKEGARDYLAKPWNDDKLLLTVTNLLRERELKRESNLLRDARRLDQDTVRRRYDLRGLVYESETMHSIVTMALQIAPSDAPVLISGPNGAGKEMIAEIIQANSRRRNRPFLKVNAGALPDELLESELFGAEAGAFTGSTRLRIGRFESASGGTLFLDEISNLSSAGQAKLLRVLQSGEFERLGSSETRRVDVRVIGATNVDLKSAIERGTFRQDLYFRLNVIELHVPALRLRREDILALAGSFLAQASAAARQQGTRDSESEFVLTPESRSALLLYGWPGNVRELQNRIQRAALVSKGSQITPDDLGLDRASGGKEIDSSSLLSAERLEKEQIERTILEASGSISRAAEILGVSRQALYRKMDKLGIVIERRPKG